MISWAFMVLRNVDRLEGIINSVTDRPNKKKDITECAKLQGERWLLLGSGVRGQGSGSPIRNSRCPSNTFSAYPRVRSILFTFYNRRPGDIAL